MRFNEYRLMEEAYMRHFGFALNRIEEMYGALPNRPENTPMGGDEAADRCWNEFLIALEELGIRFGDFPVDENGRTER